MGKRKSISTRTRFNIFKRDRFTCQYCGRTPPSVTLQIDHVLPVAAGGDNSDVNLLTSCTECNQGKSDRPLSEIPPPVNASLVDRQERLQQLKAFNKFLATERKEQDESIRRLGHFWNNQFMEERDGWVFGPNRATSIRTFLKHLPEMEILDSMEIAVQKYPGRPNKEHGNSWVYFCGICWRKIKESSPDGR